MRFRTHCLHATLIVSSLTLALAGLTGCGDDGGDLECGGFGTLHDDHCHCESGYVPSDDGLSCVPSEEAATDTGIGDVGGGGGADAGAADTGTGSGSGGQDSLTFVPSETLAATGTAEDGSRYWLVSSVDGDSMLNLELFEAFGGPSAPGVVQLGSDDTDYALCGTCIVLQTGCESHGDHFHCDKTFMPRAEGEMDVAAIGTAAGERLTAELRGVVFREVQIASDFTTTTVPGGDVLALDAWSFDAELQGMDDPSDPGEPCGGNGDWHGDHCDCDPGFRPDPSDPTNCIPE